MLYTYLIKTNQGDGWMVVQEESLSAAKEFAIMSYEYPEYVRILAILRTDILVNGFMLD